MFNMTSKKDLQELERGGNTAAFLIQNDEGPYVPMDALYGNCPEYAHLLHGVMDVVLMATPSQLGQAFIKGLFERLNDLNQVSKADLKLLRKSLKNIPIPDGSDNISEECIKLRHIFTWFNIPIETEIKAISENIKILQNTKNKIPSLRTYDILLNETTIDNLIKKLQDYHTNLK